MAQIKAWVSAFRLRTLPLAVSGILMGTLMADLYTVANMEILILSLLTAVFLQVLSNLANDYGDFSKGTDNESRIGNQRALQSGAITKGAMFRMIIVFVILSLISGIGLLLAAAKGSIDYSLVLFLCVGLAAIASAIKYTMGNNPYGYSGWGDLFVFVFFGPVAVIGTFLLHSGIEMDPGKEWPVIFPAIAMGLLSTAVLNTNNIRDIENDALSGKRTIPVKIGLAGARIYHLVLTGGACVFMVLFMVILNASFAEWLTCLAFIPIMKQALNVYRSEPSPAFNEYLKQLSLATLFLVLFFIVVEVINNALKLVSVVGNLTK